ncbi:MAG: DUF3800 domain-containing protein [Planctomycetes bacterium]|nr:DUF3800 domain-containing protein [Planctomycetota bacterium]
MSATFVVYIDESGDEGFAFEAGSTDWFVLSAIVTRKAKDLQTVKLVDEVRALLDKPRKKPLHFRDLKHEQRLPYVAAIANAPLRTVSVLVHKPSLREVEKFQERYRLYFYAVRYLLERVSWYCRDHKTARDAGDGSAEIVFSNRSGMSYDEMKRYLDLLERRTGFFDVRIEWSVIKTHQITAYSAGRRMGLQIADAVAGSFFYAVETSRHGFTEDRYVRMLKPVVYQRRGQYEGYGLKFWPREVADLLRGGERFGWLRSEYQ